MKADLDVEGDLDELLSTVGFRKQATAATYWTSRRLLLGIALLGLCGCDTGKPSSANIDRLQVGLTTYDQATALLGKPYHVDARDGRMRVIWASVSPNGTRSGVLIVFNNAGVAEEIRR